MQKNDSEKPSKNLVDLTTVKLGIVIPMANERETAQIFVEDILGQSSNFNFKSVLLYLIFDNACNDGTMNLLKANYINNPIVKIIFAPENKNVVDAYFRGYQEALNDKNDWILEIDAGYSHQPKEIPLFISAMQQGYDCVFGSRFMKGGVYQRDNLKRYMISKGGGLLVNFLVGTRLKDMTSGFEIFTHKALSSILKNKICSKGPFFQSEIKTYARKFNIKEVPIHYKDGSHSIGGDTLYDSFFCLWNLFKKRLAGKLGD